MHKHMQHVLLPELQYHSLTEPSVCLDGHAVREIVNVHEGIYTRICICWMVMRLKSLTAAVTAPCICVYTFAKARARAIAETKAYDLEPVAG